MRSAAIDDALAAVAPIVADVRDRGDVALVEWTERFDGARPDGIRVAPERIDAASVATEVLDALRQMIEAVRPSTTPSVLATPRSRPRLASSPSGAGFRSRPWVSCPERPGAASRRS